MARTERIDFTLTEKEKRVIESAADILGVSTAYFVRAAVLASAIPMVEIPETIERKLDSVYGAKAQSEMKRRLEKM